MEKREALAGVQFFNMCASKMGVSNGSRNQSGRILSTRKNNHSPRLMTFLRLLLRVQMLYFSSLGRRIGPLGSFYRQLFKFLRRFISLICRKCSCCQEELGRAEQGLRTPGRNASSSLQRRRNHGEREKERERERERSERLQR